MNKHPGVCQRVVVFLILLTYVRGILTRVCVCVCVCVCVRIGNTITLRTDG